MRLWCSGMLCGSAVLALALAAAPTAGQSSFTWRVRGGFDRGAIRSTGPSQLGGQTMPVYSGSLERSIGSRFGVGLEWTGAWFPGLEVHEQRQSLTLNGSVYPWRGLHLTLGAGPGVVSWRTVTGPPQHGAGDVVIGLSDGDPALAMTAGLGYDVTLGAFQLTPHARLIGHRLHGETVTMTALGLSIGFRTPPLSNRRVLP